MKKALFTLMILCFMCGVMSYFPVKADSYESLGSFKRGGDTYAYFSYSYDGSSTYSENGYFFQLPVGYLTTNYVHLVVPSATANNIKHQILTSDGSVFYTSYFSQSVSEFNENWIDVSFNIPVFTNIEDASHYSLGQSYNPNNIINGTGVPINWHFDNSTTFDVMPKHFEKNFKFSSNGETWNRDVAFTIKSWIVNPNEIPQGYEVMYDINMTYPTVDWLTLTYNSIFGNELPPSIGLAMGVTAQFDAGVNSLLDGVVNTTSTFTYDFDWMNSQSAYENFLTMSTVYDSSWSDHKGEQTIILKEVITDNIFGNNSYCPNGFVSQLASYYGDYQKACFALPYINVNWVGAYVINPSDGSVYDYYNTYYVDSIKSNGLVFERKGFNTQNTIDNEDIGTPSSSDTTIPSGTPKVTIPPSEMQSSYVSSIQDSYNNVTNNYYYNNTYNQDLLDYLNKYKDGGQQEDIEDAFGYLNSTLDSLSNVPLLLGKLFNGFFPPAVVILLSAMFVIFVVFLIIRIIKHLFL